MIGMSLSLVTYVKHVISLIFLTYHLENPTRPFSWPLYDKMSSGAPDHNTLPVLI